MRSLALVFVFVSLLPLQHCVGQGTVPTFSYSRGSSSYTLAGSDPARGETTTIPTTLVPLTLIFPGSTRPQHQVAMDAAPDIQKILDSPIFSRFPFASGGKTQYADAMLRSTFSSATTWHTLLAPPAVTPLTITVPPGFGYLLDSRKSGSSLAVVDADFVQKELFRQLPRQTATLVVAVTHNATFYVDGDATICCSAGTHGVDAATGTSFILGSYFENAPALVKGA